MPRKRRERNEFGDPSDTLYTGGTPLLDERTGRSIPIDEYRPSPVPRPPEEPPSPPSPPSGERALAGRPGAARAGRGHMVIVCYQPKPGQETQLLALLREHVPLLRKERLATARVPVLMRAADGTFVEIFEWVSKDAVEQAHANPAVLDLWAQFAAACDYVPIGTLPEAGAPFAHFQPVDC